VTGKFCRRSESVRGKIGNPSFSFFLGQNEGVVLSNVRSKSNYLRKPWEKACGTVYGG
jgi:hypothetical protein